jgi:thioesterase domain-containing protein
VVLSRIVPHIGSDQPVYGFKPRWVDGVREMYSSVEEEASEYLVEMRSVQPNGPYLLGGYCISGIVAMEMARQLLEAGEQVALLALIDTERPTAGRNLIARVWAGWERAKHMFSVIADAVRLDAAAHELLHRKIRNMRPGKVEILPQEAYHRSKKRYQRLIRECAAKPYTGRVTFIENESRYRFDREMGWRGFPLGEVVVKQAPGDHVTMFTEHGKELAELLLRCIDEVLPEGGRRADCIEVGAV